MDAPHIHRVFFAIWPDVEATAHLAALGHALASGGGRAMRPATLHLTLAFIGAATPTQVATLRSIGSGLRAEPFDLRLDRLGFWPQRGILWAGCRQPPAPLNRLIELLDDSLNAAGLKPDRHDGASPVPHVTLARRVRCREVPRLDAAISWHVGSFALVESHLHPSAASYRNLAEFPLAADA